MLWSYKKCQNLGIEMGLGRDRTKNLVAQRILDKIFGTKYNNPIKLDKKKKSLVSGFTCFLTAVGKV